MLLTVFHQFLVVPDFRASEAFIAQCLPVNSISSHILVGCHNGICFLHCILVALAWTTQRSLSSLQFTTEQLARHITVISCDDISHSFHLGSDIFRDSMLVDCADLQVGDTVLPINAENGVACTYVKFLQLLVAPLALMSPGLTFIEERRDKHNSVDF